MQAILAHNLQILIKKIVEKYRYFKVKHQSLE